MCNTNKSKYLRLSDSDVNKIHRLIQNERLSNTQLAARFGVSRPTIARIRIAMYDEISKRGLNHE